MACHCVPRQAIVPTHQPQPISVPDVVPARKIIPQAIPRKAIPTPLNCFRRPTLLEAQAATMSGGAGVEIYRNDPANEMRTPCSHPNAMVTSSKTRLNVAAAERAVRIGLTNPILVGVVPNPPQPRTSIQPRAPTRDFTVAEALGARRGPMNSQPVIISMPSLIPGEEPERIAVQRDAAIELGIQRSKAYVPRGML